MRRTDEGTGGKVMGQSMALIGTRLDSMRTRFLAPVYTPTDADNPPGKAQENWLYHDDKC